MFSKKLLIKGLSVVGCMGLMMSNSVFASFVKERKVVNQDERFNYGVFVDTLEDEIEPNSFKVVFGLYDTDIHNIKRVLVRYSPISNIPAFGTFLSEQPSFFVDVEEENLEEVPFPACYYKFALEGVKDFVNKDVIRDKMWDARVPFEDYEKCDKEANESHKNLIDIYRAIFAKVAERANIKVEFYDCID